jgi:ankyrin repeat protein
LAQLLATGGPVLTDFAGVGNLEGIRCLLGLGVSPEGVHGFADPYWDVTAKTTALHQAAWRARHDIVRELIAHGAPIDVLDSKGRTPLEMAVRACTDSYWKPMRKPDSVAALLAAGATTEGLDLPTGYDAIDTLLLAQNKPISG